MALRPAQSRPEIPEDEHVIAQTDLRSKTVILQKTQSFRVGAQPSAAVQVSTSDSLVIRREGAGQFSIAGRKESGPGRGGFSQVVWVLRSMSTRFGSARVLNEFTRTLRQLLGDLKLLEDSRNPVHIERLADLLIEA